MRVCLFADEDYHQKVWPGMEPGFRGNHLKLFDIIFCLACTQNTLAHIHPEIIYIKLCGFLIIHVIIPLLCVYVLYASAWCRWDHYKLSTPTSEVDGFNSSPTHSHSLLRPRLAYQEAKKFTHKRLRNQYTFLIYLPFSTPPPSR